MHNIIYRKNCEFQTQIKTVVLDVTAFLTPLDLKSSNKSMGQSELRRIKQIVIVEMGHLCFWVKGHAQSNLGS